MSCSKPILNMLRPFRFSVAKPTVILSDPFENHSNRLFQALHYEAFCIEHGYPFLNIAFLDMAKYYKGCRIGPRTALLSRVPKRLFNNRKLVHVGVRQDSQSQSHLHWACQLFPVVFVGGFNFWVHELTTKYQNYFVKKYALKACFLNDVPLVHKINEWKSSGHAVVGLHIRRGDYQYYRNGRYFYDDSIYANLSVRFATMLSAKGCRIKIVAFSNDSTCIEQLIECKLSVNEWYIDHHLMSLCDMLIGPPSTFTAWASYIGRVPCFHLETPTSPFDLNSFRCNYG
jgi:hypothetical protein